MQQYTITEHNDWEGETFGYIMSLTDEEKDYIVKKLNRNFTGIELDDSSFSFAKNRFSECDIFNCD